MNTNEVFYAGFGVTIIIITEDIQRYYDFVPFQRLETVNR